MSAKTVERFITGMTPFNPTRTYLLGLFRLDVEMVRGIGHLLYDRRGAEYLDFLSQFGAVSLGYNHPEICDVIVSCLSRQVPAMVQPFISAAAQDLAARLSEITPGDLAHSIFTNSGAETVEAAIKLARAKTRRSTILSTINGFHGNTLGALSATGKAKYQKPFGAPVAGFEYVPFGDLDSLESRLHCRSDLPAAFLVEPIQGEGGVIPAPAGYIASAMALCRQNGVLFILDEIQTGLGRTGRMFALPDGAGIPDILLLSKSLGGGCFPIGACVCTERTWNHEFGYLHSSTFANNGLACSVALKVVEILTRDGQRIVKNVAEQGEYLLRRLGDLQMKYPSTIKHVRGRGFLAGIEFHPFTGDDSYTMAYFSHGDYLIPMLCGYLLNVHRVITAPVFNHAHVLRIAPSFMVGRPEIDRLIDALDSLCETIDRKNYSAVIRYLTGQYAFNESQTRFVTPNRPNPTYSGDRQAAKAKGSFAFILHPTDDADFLCCDPSFEQFTPKELAAWKDYVERVEPGVVYHLKRICSKADRMAEGWLIALFLLPDAVLKSSHRQILTLLKDAIDVAKGRGARIVGLGGFTSIVSKGGQKLVGRGIAITSGSCLTSVMAIESVENLLGRDSRQIRDMTITIVGANGAVGRLVTLLLANRVARLTLVGSPLTAGGLPIYSVHDEAHFETGRNPSDARQSAEAFRSLNSFPAGIRTKTPITYTRNLDLALRDADVVVVATSSSEALIGPEPLKPGAIVCDISRPHNVMREVSEKRQDVLVFDGGLVELPEAVHFGPNLQGFRPGITLACLAESMLLALEGDYTDHSIGRELTIAEASYIAGLARKHGFRAAPPHWHSRELHRTDSFRKERPLGQHNQDEVLEMLR